MVRGVLWMVAMAAVGCRFDEGGVPYSGPDAEVPARPDGGGGGDGGRPDAGNGGTDARAPDAPAVACPSNYVRLGEVGTLYRLGNGATDWDVAEADCAADAGGTHLAVLDDVAELGLVTRLVGTGDAWIGVTNRVDPDRFLTVLGDDAAVLPWRNGLPPGNRKVCVALIGPDRLVDWFRCGEAHRYVCECDGAEPDPDAF